MKWWEWRCCGLLWQLIPSRRYPERDGWHPVCPRCGRIPPRRWAERPG